MGRTRRRFARRFQLVNSVAVAPFSLARLRDTERGLFCYNAPSILATGRKVEKMDEEILDDVEQTRGIEEGEADRRIDEFRDIVRRMEELRDQLAQHSETVLARLDSLAAIAVDNGGGTGVASDDGAGDYAQFEGVDEEFLQKDWAQLEDELRL